MTKVRGARVRPSTQPMPNTVAMSNGASVNPNPCFIQVFRIPILKCSMNSQPMATVKPGMRRPMVMNVNNTVFPGRSVRSASHAAGIPNAQDTTRAISENSMVVRRAA